MGYNYCHWHDSLTEPVHRNESNIPCSIAPGDDLASRESYKHAGVARSKSEARRSGMDMRHLVRLVCQAFLNPSEFNDPSALPNVECFYSLHPLEYYTKCIKAGCNQKQFKFLNPEFGAFSEPLTVVDSKGCIILWYYPGLMPNHQQISIYLWCA